VVEIRSIRAVIRPIRIQAVEPFHEGEAIELRHDGG
jgi:hypothetical protein